MRITKLAAIVLVLSVAAAGWLHAAEAPKPPPLDLKGVRILVCAGYFDLMNIPAVRKLASAGAEVRSGKLAALTWATAQQYHVIIAVDEPPVPKKVEGEGPVQVLEKFVKAGGGVLFFCQFMSAKEDVNKWLAPFGGTLLREFIQDPQHTFKNPTGFNLSYAYTESVTSGHPLTEGVKGIWYNAQLNLFHTSSIDVSKDWKVLVAGEASAKTTTVGGLYEEHIQSPGKYQSSPPIIAAREMGAGAIVLVGISPMEAFYGQGLPAYQDIMMEKGDGMRKSDFRRFYENALRWLANHGKAAAGLGQGDLKPLVNSWANRPQIDWSKNILGGQQCTKPIKGVIGLHSTLSDGKATPEALIAKARESGLQWVAFTEKFELLAAGPWTKKPITTGMLASAGERTETISPDKWEQLRKICREASTDDFAVLPGLDYADNTGDRWVVFGDFNWPPEKVFSPDKKKIIQPQWWFNIGTVPNGPYNATKNHLRPWDYSMYNMWPIRTTIDDKQVDDALAAFHYVQGNMDDPFPMAVDMIYTEEQLAAASQRMCNYVTLDKPGNLAKFYQGHMYYGSARGFVSDGPVVTDWRCYNDGRIAGEKWYLPTSERYRLKLSVQSSAPEVTINDIKFYDGPYLFRRYCPKQPKVTITIDAPHDKQHNIFAEITDSNGKTAITGGYSLRDYANWRFMCGDRGNSICDGVQTDKAGPYLMGPTAPYQRKMTAFGVCAGYGTRHFNVLPPNFDGGMRPIGMHVIPRIKIPGFTLQPPNSTLEARNEIPVCSRDGILQEDTITGYFTTNASAWVPKLAPVDIKDVTINYRYLNITPRAGDPGVILLEGKIGFTKAAKVESLAIFSVSHTSQPGEGDHYAMVTPEQNIVGLTHTTPFNVVAPMAPGSYVAEFPSLWGATGAMALDDGYVASVYAKFPGVHLSVSLGNMPREMKAGEELKYRLILMHGRPNELPNTADWENFAKAMGFRGNPAYKVKDVKVGKVKGTKFLLELEPSDSGFAGTISACDLPIRLPIRVAGMNQNWTFAYFDLDRKEWFPSAVDQVISQGYFTLDTRRGNHRIFAGHPVLADNKDLRILVLSDGASKVQASVNNVGDAAVDATIRLNPALGKAAPVKVHLGSGEVKDLEFTFGP
ncbi:MAG: hypothetical protein L6437_10230 [Kiritimatiellae bacterium]|nr:hypothetical protein [Verrucomicrobiota bacterium]MCG2660608.1 hypothetical protein [Kiritimatiellia bacterium]